MKPFEASTSKVLLAKPLTEEPKSLLEANPLVRVSPAIESIALRMLAKSPSDRPASMQRLYLDLAALAHDAPVLTPV